METALAVDAVMDVGRVSAARKRRERRLRQFLRHERLSVAIALSEKKHHTSRGQRKDKAGEEGRGSEKYYTAKFRDNPPPQPELFQLFEEEPSGSQPPCLEATRSGAAAHRGAARRRRAHQYQQIPTIQIPTIQNNYSLYQPTITIIPLLPTIPTPRPITAGSNRLR